LYRRRSGFYRASASRNRRAKGTPSTRDEDRIQGTGAWFAWDQLNHEPTEDEKAAWRARQLKVTITADKIIFRKERGAFQLDATTNPDA